MSSKMEANNEESILSNMIPDGQGHEEMCADFLREQLREYIFYKDVRRILPEYVHEYVSRHSNNHHVVPLGILSVLFCIYFGTLLLSEIYVIGETTNDNGMIPPVIFNESLSEKSEDQLQDEDNKGVILNKLLEHKDICYDVEVFREDLTDVKPTFIEPEEVRSFQTDTIPVENYLLDQDFNEIKRPNPKPKQKLPGHKVRMTRRFFGKHANHGKNGRHSRNGRNGRNGRHGKHDKQENIPIVKKKTGSTAEPIIYCFALAFLYLLLRAVSDINDHYKEKKKNEKGARRCSLQSYAQAHRQDRRASKEDQKQSPQETQFSDSRSSSVDRFGSKLTKEQLTKKSQLLLELRKYASYEEKQSIDNSLESINIQSQLLDMDQMLAESPCSSPRRCSLGFQRSKMNAMFPHEPIPRRTSIASGIGATMGVSIHSLGIGLETAENETKRRVRMINRH